MSAIIKALAQLARSTYDGEEHRPMDDIRRAICAAAVREHDRLLLDRGELCRLIGALADAIVLGHQVSTEDWDAACLRSGRYQDPWLGCERTAVGSNSDSQVPRSASDADVGEE